MGCLVGQEGGQRPLDDPRREVEHDEDGGAEQDERDAEPAEVSGDGQVMSIFWLLLFGGEGYFYNMSLHWASEFSLIPTPQ